ncbi:histidinol-phosphate transaminase [Helicobacter sp.]|uniref:pyridoxal phosphate-dependent aminotransferase n=1 Tax=Helicobacter sp. TaxID=218 RepID=UPI0025BCACE4|nr:histidinol-phosphate transaminase [Helicobacter sp.]MBR2494943.1 histidinol-phosphate aminotransferase family protein [Helicobacter sp.]
MQSNLFIQTLKPYIPIAHKIWETPNQSAILKLDWNESTKPPSPKVFAALEQALQHDNLHWYPNTKNETLLQLLSTYTALPSSCIELFASSDCAHEFILQVFAKTLDSVCIIAPTYDNFRSSAQGRGLQSLFFYTDESGKIDWHKLDVFLESKNPQMLYICNPNNPTGTLHDINALQSLIYKYKHIAFIVDEAYYEFCGISLGYIVPHTPNLIITRTFSKAFGLASFRIGYCLSAPQNIAALNRLRNAKNIPHFSQIAAIAALEDIAYMQQYVKEVKKAKQYFLHELESIQDFTMYHTEANFVFLHYNNAAALCDFLESKGVYIRNYTHILPNHCRISIGTKTQMQKVASYIQDFIAQTHTIKEHNETDSSDF